MVHRSTTTRWKERLLTKQEKQSTKICLTLVILSQTLALRYCYMLMPSFIEINMSQSDNWHSSLSISTGSSHIIHDLGYSNIQVCARHFSLQLHGWTQNHLPLRVVFTFSKRKEFAWHEVRWIKWVVDHHIAIHHQEVLQHHGRMTGLSKYSISDCCSVAAFK